MFCDHPFCDSPFASFLAVIGNGEIFYFDGNITRSPSFFVSIDTKLHLIFDIQQSKSFDQVR